MRKSIPVPFILFVIGIAFVSICLSSCGAAKNNRQKSLFLKTDHQPDFHTVHSNQLKNVMKKPVIVKTFGKTEVKTIDLSDQNISDHTLLQKPLISSANFYLLLHYRS